jgi:hypothetical protein
LSHRCPSLRRRRRCWRCRSRAPKTAPGANPTISKKYICAKKFAILHQNTAIPCQKLIKTFKKYFSRSRYLWVIFLHNRHIRKQCLLRHHKMILYIDFWTNAENSQTSDHNIDPRSATKSPKTFAPVQTVQTVPSASPQMTSMMPLPPFQLTQQESILWFSIPAENFSYKCRWSNFGQDSTQKHQI